MAKMSRDLAIAGMTPLSTIDFPGHLAAVLYVRGCPLRCRYCHNAPMQSKYGPIQFSWSRIGSWLRQRRELLDGVVFSGGEPTSDTVLGNALAEVRDLHFATGLHTSGVYPERIKRLLELLDWVGLDFKAPFDRYAKVTGSVESGVKAVRTLEAILASGVDYEVRTTVHHLLLTPDDLEIMAKSLQFYGVKHWVLQKFRPQGCVDEELVNTPSILNLDTVAWLHQWVPEILVRE